ncbi:hypothetical protein caldi_12310 [Caldinitratiruptor microaerophilus]|uniref:Uncharacterized protein n=1 Tax=Caldinitratiruptor microaerophilus TaxID=671077 RepID=A0AA35G7I8_9FIRM|nr:hypothetical protein caldi_12310 [Caldinitratiruptor microaerophilus]
MTGLTPSERCDRNATSNRFKLMASKFRARPAALTCTREGRLAGAATASGREVGEAWDAPAHR